MKREKIYNLILFILIFIVILSIILLKPLGDLDELWNYNFARNMSNGCIPYKDFNMLQMPLLPMVCGIILKIICDELVIMRILATVLCSLIIYMAYKLFRILNVKKEISIIFLFLIGYLFKDVLCIDYNYASLLVTLIIIYNEIKVYKKSNEFIKANIKQDVFLGILAGLTITLKQTTGLFICLALLGNKLLFVKNKEEFNYYIKSFLCRMIGILIPVGLMIIYLIINNALGDFVSYTIKGVSGFSNYISYKSLIKFNLLGILSILVPIMFIYEWIKTICLEKNKIEYIFLVYGLAMFVVCFPISNDIHFLIGALPIIILTLYEIYSICKTLINNKLNKKEYKKIDFLINFIIMLSTLILLLHTIINFYDFFTNSDNFSNLKHFKYINISKEFDKQISFVDEYIENNDKVIILSASAPVYMIPIDRYNKDYDMLLKGNLGYNGEQRIIEQISKENDIQYLILNDKYQDNWQTPMDIIEYVKENKTKIGEILLFDIYK